MSLRLNTLVLYPQAVFLVMAALFFCVLTYRMTCPALVGRRLVAAGWVAAVAVTAGLGAWGYAAIGALAGGGVPSSGLLAGTTLRFGSFGGYLGALAAAWGLGALTQSGPWRAADRAVPAVLVAGGIARLGCVFHGCCRGSDVVMWYGVRPFVHWPLYDLAAHVLVLCAVGAVLSRKWRISTGGLALVVFLFGYGLLRFALEFFRASERLWGELTPGQWLALVQVALGVGIATRWYGRIVKKAVATFASRAVGDADTAGMRS